MKDFKAIQWFLNELPDLRKNGLLDASTAERLTAHYREELGGPPVRNTLFFCLGTLGALLIAAAVILLTAYNWDMIEKPGRIANSFVPFLLAAGFGIFVIVRGKDGVWREGAALFLGAGILSLNALISQIYHIEGEPGGFLALNLPFLLALTVMFRANVLALLTATALIPFSFFLLQPDGDVPSWFAPVYILLWTPYAVRQIRKGSFLLRWGAVAAAIALLTWGQCVLAIPLAGAAFLCGGLNFHRLQAGAWSRDPWIQSAYLLLTVYFLICTFTTQPVLCKEFSMLTAGSVTLLFLFMLAAELRRNCNALNLTVAFCAAYPYLAVLKTEWAIPAAFGFLILLAAMFLIDGFRRSDLLLMNLGQLQLYALLVAHFFSADSILTRAGAFFTAGVAFLVLNFFLSRHFRGKGAPEQ